MSSNISISAAIVYNKQFAIHASNLASAGAVAGKTKENFITTFDRTASSGIQSNDIRHLNQVGDSFDSTESTNFAIGGQGLTVVRNQPDSTGQIGFCRDGTFTIDSDLNLVNGLGQYLQAYTTDANGDPLNPDVSTATNLTTANVKNQLFLPKATSKITTAVALSSQAVVGGTTPGGTLGTHQTSVPAFDSHGNSHNLTATFTKVAPNTAIGQYDIWTVKMEDLTSGATAAGEYGAGTMTIAFDQNGKPLGYNLGQTTTTSPTAPTGAITYPYTAPATRATVGNITTTSVAVTTTDGASPATYTTVMHTYDDLPPNLNITWDDETTSTIKLNLGTIGESDGVFVSGNKYIDFVSSQDGYGLGNFSSLEITKDGFGIIHYSNGQNIKSFRIPLATFNNVNGLTETSPGVFQVTSKSGNYNFQFPGQQNAGVLIPSSYEGSSVDTTKVYLDMIDTQRIFTSNLKAIEINKEMQSKINNI